MTFAREHRQIAFKSLLNRSMTTKEDLQYLMFVLDLPGNVAWSIDFDTNQPYQIINIGNGIIGGTHWVAVDNVHKRYFDSFGQAPPPMIPHDYQWMPIDIQDIRYGHCGQYAALFLWFSSQNEIDKFYNMFRSI